MAGGRPTDFDDVMAEMILKRLSQGETVSSICREKGMPAASSVFLWSSTYPEFSERYLLALKGVGQIKVDKISDVIEEMKSRKIDPAVGKIEIDALKWMAGRFYPKMYGDKQVIESENKNQNINVTVEVPLTETDRAILRDLGWTE